VGNRAAAPRTYRRREPEHGALHRTIREHLETFLAEERAKDPDGDGVPRFVADELRAYLTCGVLAHGFARFRCTGCATERLVAFSCKGRGVCSSCAGRRMTARAADLVDRVLGGRAKLCCQIGVEAPVQQGASPNEYASIRRRRNAAGRDASTSRWRDNCDRPPYRTSGIDSGS